MNLRKISQKQEREVAKQFKGKTTIASGALWFQKSDVISDKCNLECKTTTKDFYSVSANVWEKIEKEAIKSGDKIPLLVLDITYKCHKDRFIVFKGRYFSSPFSFDEEPRRARPLKSRRIYADSMEKIYPLDAYNFRIKGLFEHNLFCMYDYVFIDTFRKELNL